MKPSKIFLGLAIFGFLTLAASALAATGDYEPLVKIPGVDTKNFLNYLRDMYNFLISIVGILAMASLVYGGMRYLTSVGNPASVEDAKDIINSAIVGLILALSSWLILNTINPDVLVLKKPGQIGALPGKYAYGETSFAKCFTNVDDPSYGTEDNPCQCMDGTKQHTTKTKTNLTLSLSPTSPAPSAPDENITISGVLTDDEGKGISGKTITINTINDALGVSDTFTLTTTPTGEFTTTRVVDCSATDTIQAVFDGDANYTFAVSSSITVTYGGTPNCAAGNYNNTPPSVKVRQTSICQNLCSDKSFAKDGKNHCGSKFLRVKLDTQVLSEDTLNYEM
ncbi:MAG TPA: hypothetical protein DHV62_07890, partial [Elusimicrobia bacterium]|nr:hypothetical protein [Elusimicrobiota bacterium]